MELLTDFLKKRAQINFDRLLAQVESITPDQAFEGRMENWPIHSFGIGQDGSIAGIVIHVAAWKHLTLPIFIKDEVLNTRDDLDINSFCEINDWTSIVKWLKQVGELWMNLIIRLPNENYLKQRLWGNKSISVLDFIVETIEHDVQHASQIEYLKVLRDCKSACNP